MLLPFRMLWTVAIFFVRKKAKTNGYYISKSYLYIFSNKISLRKTLSPKSVLHFNSISAFCHESFSALVAGCLS